MVEANIKRGEKWKKVKAECEFKNMQKDVEWINSQKNILEDIKSYEDSIEPKPETKEKKEKK